MSHPTEETVVSSDGTHIALTKSGAGPALILVDGALCHRHLGKGKALAALIEKNFTVYRYDRRGRGSSTDTTPYSPLREIEDLEAVLTHAGGSAFLWGESSGGALVLQAARRLAGVRAIAVYEVPFVVHSPGPSTSLAWKKLRNELAAGQRANAVATFLKMIGTPSLIVALMRLLPIWPKLVAIAPTLAYDGDLVSQYQLGGPLSPAYWSTVKCRALVLAGERSRRWMQTTAAEIAQSLPQGKCVSVPGQNHNLKASGVAPLLSEFFLQD